MDPGSAAELGALGGAAVQLTRSFAQLVDFQEKRTRAAKRKSAPPLWHEQFDVGVDVAILAARALIGAGVATLLHAQFTGALTAVMTGASGPLLLAQWGAGAERARSGSTRDELGEPESS